MAKVVLWASMAGLIGGVGSSVVGKVFATLDADVRIQATANVRARGVARAKPTATKHAAAKKKPVAKKTGDSKLLKEKSMRNSVTKQKSVWIGAMPYPGGPAHPNRESA
jgi:hypothetical protein